MKSQPTIDPRLLIAVDYRWRGGISACYEIISASGETLFSVWSQTHAIIILALCKKIQRARKKPRKKRTSIRTKTMKKKANRIPKIHGRYFKDTTGTWNYEATSCAFLSDAFKEAKKLFRIKPIKHGIIVWFNDQPYPLFPKETVDQAHRRANIQSKITNGGIPLDGSRVTGFSGLQRLSEDPGKMVKGWQELMKEEMEAAH